MPNSLDTQEAPWAKQTLNRELGEGRKRLDQSRAKLGAAIERLKQPTPIKTSVKVGPPSSLPDPDITQEKPGSETISLKTGTTGQ